VKRPRSLQARLALSLGVLLTVLWIAAASVTAVILRGEMDRVFDSALQETAQRLLPLAVVDIVGREEDGVTQRLGAIRQHNEFFTYIVRDTEGRVLLQSHAADLEVFADYYWPGFRQTATHRLYNDDALQGTIRITVAEPLEHRAAVAREIQMGLGLPLLLVVPLALLSSILAVRASLAPLRRFRDRLEARSARDLSPVPSEDIPSEIAPVAATLNALLDRLKATFDAERSFAANAAHELRTPLAGAIAQAQRLQSETHDPAAAARAVDIEATLKRLTRLSERLMQLARADGGRLRADTPCDLRPVLRVVSDDLARTVSQGRLVLDVPDAPVMSDLDPDALAILARNLIENALRHGSSDGAVEVSLAMDGGLTVANDGPAIPPDRLSHLTERFVQGGGAEGSGLGLAIVSAIARRVGAPLHLRSPRPGTDRGLAVTVHLPLAEA
jgi:two-component system OmpR family sensor kinase